MSSFLGNVEIGKVHGSLRQIIAQAASLCGRFEQGRSETPLGDQCSEVTGSLRNDAFTVALLGLHTDAAARTLEAVGCSDARSVLDTVPPEVAVLRLRLGSDRFILRDCADVLAESESAAKVVAALGTRMREGNGMCSPDTLLVEVPSSPQWAGAELLVITDLDGFLRSPHLQLNLLTRSRLLVLCGSADYLIAPEQAAQLEEILPSSNAVLPVAVGGSSVTGFRGWWKLPLISGCPVVLPEVTMNGAQEYPWNLNPADPADQTRIALTVIEASRKLKNAMQMTTAGCEQEIKTCSQKQAELAVADKRLEERARPRDPRMEAEAFRGMIDESASRIQEEVDITNRRAMQRRGVYATIIRRLVESVDRASLDETVGVKTIRKTLRQDVLRTLTGELASALHKQLQQDAAVVGRGITKYQESLTQSLQKAAPGATLNLPMFNGDEAWKHMQGEIVLEIRGEIEIEKTAGMMVFLTEARSFIMPLFMTLSMIGISRTAISHIFGSGFFLLAGFILIGMYAVSERIKEREERIVRDLDKLRESISMEATKIVSDVQREKAFRLSAYLNEVKKASLRQIEAIVSAQVRQNATEIEDERKKVRHQSRLFDQRLRELQDIGRQLTRVEQTVNEVYSTAIRLVTEPPRPVLGPIRR